MAYYHPFVWIFYLTREDTISVDAYIYECNLMQFKNIVLRSYLRLRINFT